MRAVSIFSLFCIIILAMIPLVIALDAPSVAAPPAASDKITIEAKDSSVLLNGMNIAEKAKGQSYVSSNLMVTYSMGVGKVASTASVPSKYSSTGALMQIDFGGGKGWYYLKEISKDGENIWEGKERATVSWEYPLIVNQEWKPAGVKDNLAEIPEGEDIHFIANGNLVLPGKFIIYSVEDDEEGAAESIADPAKDCSNPGKRCSATLKTSDLDEGYYYVVYTWESGGKTYLSNSMGVKIGDPGEKGKEEVVFNDAQTGADKKLSWTPKYAQYYGTWGDMNKEDMKVYQWSDNPSGISIGTSTSRVEYDIDITSHVDTGEGIFSGLSFEVDTDWKTHTTLIFDNHETIDLKYDGGKIIIKPSETGDWGNGLILTNESNQRITISKNETSTANETPSQQDIPSLIPATDSVDEYSPNYKINDWLKINPAQERPQIGLSLLADAPFDYNAVDELAAGTGIDITRDIADPAVIGMERVSDSKIKFSNLLVSGESADAKYSWDFGDGTASEEQNPTHSFKRSGNLIATLTITATTDSGVKTSTQSVPVTVTNTGFFGGMIGFFSGLFGSGDKKEYASAGPMGGLVTVSSGEQVKIAADGKYHYGTTDPKLATVDGDGVVTFTEAFTQGSAVGILSSNEDEGKVTLIRYSGQEADGAQKDSKSPIINGVMMGDSPVDINGRVKAVTFSATSETLDENILEAAAEEISNAGVEEIKGQVDSGARDALGELLKLKGEGWVKAYEIIRKLYEGGETVKGISDDKLSCLENFRDFLKSPDDVSASLNFYSFCMCIYGYAGDSRVAFIGDLFCKWKMPSVPNPQEMDPEVRQKWIDSIDDSINEYKEPGYIEKKTKACEEAKKGCDKAKSLVEQAKKLVSEVESLTEEAREAYDDARAANERAAKAAEDSYSATSTADAVGAANRAAAAAKESEAAAQAASSKSEEAKRKSDEAKALLVQALDLCPGNCAPKDGSSEIINDVNSERGKIWKASQYWEYSRSAVMVAWDAGNRAEVVVEFAKAKLAAEQKKSCDKALEYARAAAKASENMASSLKGLNEKLTEMDDLEALMNKLESEATQIRNNERFEGGIKLKDIADDAGDAIKSGEKSLEDMKKLQSGINDMADKVKKMSSAVEKALSEGSPEDPKCIEAKKLMQQALDAANQAAADAASAVNAAQKNLDNSKQSKSKIDEIRDEWEKKRRTIRVYTYTNSAGETVIWGGNGDAQPPAGSTYSGTMQSGKWTDGGPPQVK